ncbi:hypothetical protein ABNG03_00160 [Halorubrum sp. RMP-47]|uniref:Uncharacterized protein n=1 Tax=Halorubrum miltondacostae TaxID=3076378 RepID=A0ABD5LZ29_9EURY
MRSKVPSEELKQEVGDVPISAHTLQSPQTYSIGLNGLDAQTGYEARATADAVNDDATDAGSILSFTTDAPSGLEEEFDNFNQWNFQGISSSGAPISSARVAPNSTNGTAMYATEDIGHGQEVSEFNKAMTWNFDVNQQYSRVVWHYNENSGGQGGVGM